MSKLLAAVLALSAAVPSRAQVTTSPVDALAGRLAADGGERARAGETLEAFLLDAGSPGGSFVADGADRAALGAVARDWARREDPARLAALVFLCERGSPGEARLRGALSRWTGSGSIQRASEVRATAALLSDAADKAAAVLGDGRARREIDAAIAANDAAAPLAPGVRESIARAGRLSDGRRGASAAVFGPDRAVQDLAAGSARTGPAAGGRSSPAVTPGAAARARGAAAAIAPAAQLPLSQGKPDRIVVPSPLAGGSPAAPAAAAGRAGAGAPSDGRVAPAKPVSAWERIKDSVRNPLSDAYGFTFEGLEASPVAFRDHTSALAYMEKAKPGSFTKVTFYGHGAPGFMTVGSWGADAADIASRLKGRMRPGGTVEIKGCNTASIGSTSVNPGRGISGLTRRVLYFSIPYLSGDRSEASKEYLEEAWNADIARDASRDLPGVRVCGYRTFGLVASRLPVLGTLTGRREATDSSSILGSKACYLGGKEIER